ncbi:hypothetical protein CLV47_11815 [Antricoccus suffuscus]|uniref:Uncharacterized protein n=1 Tax=Antricoccus suffuscus TaxID=1629062 RepID=A0A2T0ZTH2_9ACTN|nr:hypothetical protein [Antricoccus suffuscus]PRZ39651.1 hypothetical protein CLV47_11815 [Antricoccus suffuscus]
MAAVNSDTVADSLRAWARGNYALEAAAEMVIRAASGRYADPGQPWITAKHQSGGGDRYMLDVDAITDQNIGALSGGEQRVLRIVASLAGGAPVRLDDVAGLDRGTLDLALAAIAHAGGSHEHSDVAVDPDGGDFAVMRLGSLHPWPTGSTPPRWPTGSPS